MQAYLPDALGAMIRLQEWSAARRARGGAPIKVRVVKGANLPMERVDASLHDWPLATWGSKQDTDTNYKRVLDYACSPSGSATSGSASPATTCSTSPSPGCWPASAASATASSSRCCSAWRRARPQVVKREVGGLLLYTPVVHPAEFDVAIAYLIRRLEEGASQDNFMSAVFDLHDDPELFERERERFLASLAGARPRRPAAQPGAGPPRAGRRRRRCRASTTCPTPTPSLPANTAWSRAILERVATSTVGRRHRRPPRSSTPRSSSRQ